MQLTTFEHGGRTSYGAVKDGGIVDLGARLGRDAPALLDLIGSELVDQAREVAGREAPDIAIDRVEIERPLPAPGKILCIGVNYLDRNAEYKDGSGQPEHPSVFVRFPASFVAHGEPLVRPLETGKFDYEGEITLVIGRRGRRIAREAALSHLFGYTIADCCVAFPMKPGAAGTPASVRASALLGASRRRMRMDRRAGARETCT